MFIFVNEKIDPALLDIKLQVYGTVSVNAIFWLLVFLWLHLFNCTGIANALDLTDRILPRLQARPKCRPELLHFCPYSKDQIATILVDRVNHVSRACLLFIYLSIIFVINCKLTSASESLTIQKRFSSKKYSINPCQPVLFVIAGWNRVVCKKEEQQLATV